MHTLCWQHEAPSDSLRLAVSCVSCILYPVVWLPMAVALWAPYAHPMLTARGPEWLAETRCILCILYPVSCSVIADGRCIMGTLCTPYVDSTRPRVTRWDSNHAAGRDRQSPWHHLRGWLGVKIQFSISKRQRYNPILYQQTPALVGCRYVHRSDCGASGNVPCSTYWHPASAVGLRVRQWR